MLELRHSMVADPAASGRRPPKPRVVNDHRHAVCGEVNVQLDSVGALASGQLESGKSVLRCLTRRSPVSYIERRPEEGYRPIPLNRAREQRFQDCQVRLIPSLRTRRRGPESLWVGTFRPLTLSPT